MKLSNYIFSFQDTGTQNLIEKGGKDSLLNACISKTAVEISVNNLFSQVVMLCSSLYEFNKFRMYSAWIFSHKTNTIMMCTTYE